MWCCPVAEEKDFCTLLSELIVDERKADADYRMLKDLFGEEIKLLLPKEPVPANRFAEALIDSIRDSEGSHLRLLETLRTSLCV